MSLTSQPLRSMRWRANAPRIALYAVAAILSLAGLRSIVEEPVVPGPAVAAPVAAGNDVTVNAFAESFARDYLTWKPNDSQERERRLGGYLAGALEPDAGLDPAADTSQQVTWTSVLGVSRDGDGQTVTVAANTTAGPRYLSVPVARDDRGFLYVRAHPALVGPPATAEDSPPKPTAAAVEDTQLLGIVERALTNYLARSQYNLLADLTPDAVVSLPPEALRVTRVSEVAWVADGHRVAVEVEAEDKQGSSLTLRYELEVLKRDRWYVRSLHVDPTFDGGR